MVVDSLNCLLVWGLVGVAVLGFLFYYISEKNKTNNA
ncbi:hypothetical protein J2S31_001688 [Nitrospina gracilis Nb-211]|nr:hypothetical protein [Nitrospina gracilis Nb-211]